MPDTTLVDANVLLDILTSDPVWLPWSSTQLQQAASSGQVLIDPIIRAEITPAFTWIGPAWTIGSPNPLFSANPSLFVPP